MAKHIGYINPSLLRQTIELLKDYKAAHPDCATPMAAAFAATPNTTADDRLRFIRAAKSLGWRIARSQGRYYENGILIW